MWTFRLWSNHDIQASTSLISPENPNQSQNVDNRDSLNVENNKDIPQQLTIEQNDVIAAVQSSVYIFLFNNIFIGNVIKISKMGLSNLNQNILPVSLFERFSNMFVWIFCY